MSDIEAERALGIKWRSMRRTLLVSLLVATAAGGGFAYWLWGPSSSIILALAVLCLALGFWVTEMLIGVLVKVKQASASAIVLLILAKLGWWVALFWAARRVPAGQSQAVALGIVIFLLALLASTFRHFGMQRVSDVETDRDP